MLDSKFLSVMFAIATEIADNSNKFSIYFIQQVCKNTNLILDSFFSIGIYSIISIVKKTKVEFRFSFKIVFFRSSPFITLHMYTSASQKLCMGVQVLTVLL